MNEATSEAAAAKSDPRDTDRRYSASIMMPLTASSDHSHISSSSYSSNLDNSNGGKSSSRVDDEDDDDDDDEDDEADDGSGKKPLAHRKTKTTTTMKKLQHQQQQQQQRFANGGSVEASSAAVDTDEEEEEEDEDEDDEEARVYQDNNHNDNKTNNKSNLVKNSSSFPNEFNTNINNGNAGSTGIAAPAAAAASATSTAAATANDNKFSKYKSTSINNATSTADDEDDDDEEDEKARATYLSRNKKLSQLLTTNSYDDAAYNSSDFELDSKKELLMPNESDASALNSKRNSNVSQNDNKSKSISNMSKEMSSAASGSVNERAPFLTGGGRRGVDSSLGSDRTSSAAYRKNLLLFESNLSSAGTGSSRKETFSSSGGVQEASGAAGTGGRGAGPAAKATGRTGQNQAKSGGGGGGGAKRKGSKTMYIDSSMGLDYGERHSSTLIDMHGLDANTTTRESQLANLNNIQTSDSLSTLSDKKKKVIVRIVTVFSVVFFLICFAMIAFTLRMSEKIDAQIRKSYTMGGSGEANSTRNLNMFMQSGSGGVTIQPLSANVPRKLSSDLLHARRRAAPLGPGGFD